MPRVCTICTHPERETIDAAIVGGEPYRSITERFSVSAGAIARHKSDHLPATLAQATEAQEIAHAGDLALRRGNVPNVPLGSVRLAAL